FVSSSSFRIVNDTAIRSAFTRDAWEKKVRDELPKIAKRLTKEDWILGLSGDQTGLHETKLRSHYFNLYINEWEEFLKAIYVVVDPIDKVQAQNILDDLLHGSPHPMAYLF